MSSRRFIRPAVAIFLLMIALGSVAHWQVSAGSEPAPTAVIADAPLCRFGVNVINGETFTDHDATPLRIGWYLNYLATANVDEPPGVDFVPIIRLRQINETEYSYLPNGTTLLNAINAAPGSTWVIGNEPDRRTSIQDNVEPHIYAAAYHELYHLIKQADPTAEIVAGAIVQPTPLRLKYLDMVLDNYYVRYGQAMPVDAWSVHNFILNEVSCSYDPTNCWGAEIPPGLDDPYGEIIDIDDNDDFDRFVERIVRFRHWMRDRGYGNLPLYLSEYGILMPADFGFDAARVNAFMDKTFDYMNSAIDPALGYPADGYRLVQKWSWYSTTDVTYNGWLFDPASKGLTAVGQNFADYTKTIVPQNDLSPWKLMTTPASPHYQGTPLSIQLRATVTNSGDLANPAGPAIVRFYRGNPAQGGVKIGTDQVVNLSGCGDSAVASVTWNGVGPGPHEIYVVVDAGNTIAESNETNNTKVFTVFVGTKQTFLSAIAR